MERVLVTGGYGFIGSFVAERFYREGYEVHILDDLSSGSRENVSFKHKSHIMSVEDERCEELFRANGFDVVVHLAAQVKVSHSIARPLDDVRANIVGLTNMLAWSQAYRVRKFIFASSAAVYGTQARLPLGEDAPCEPMSPYGLNKWLGELYCRFWQEWYGLETIVFRFANVYGPRQLGGSDGGVVAIFLEQATDGRPLTVFGDGEQTRDFIYVEDVADAVFRAAVSPLTGVYNLSTGEETSLKRLIGEIRRHFPDVRVEHLPPRPGDIRRSALDSSRLRKDLDWVPLIDLEEGLRRTAEWHRRRRRSAARRGRRWIGAWKHRFRFLKKFSRFQPVAEHAALFAVVAKLSAYSWFDAYAFVDARLLYTLIAGMLFGGWHAVAAALLASALFVLDRIRDGYDWFATLYDAETYFRMTIYFAVGLIVGHVIDRHRAQTLEYRRNAEELRDRYEFLENVYEDLREVKEELQRQILSHEDSFAKIYAIAKELDDIDPEHVLAAIVSVVERIMHTDAVSVYMLNRETAEGKEYLRLAARSRRLEDLPGSLKIGDWPYLQAVTEEHAVFVNHELRPDVPMLAAPVTLRGELLAVIAIHDLPFERMNHYLQNLFKVTADLVSTAMSRAFAYAEATKERRYMPGLPVLRSEAFWKAVKAREKLKEKYDIDYSLLKWEPTFGTLPFADTARKLAGSLRFTDFLGTDGQGGLYVLLTNAGPRETKRVVERLASQGIVLVPWQEERDAVG